MKKYTVLTQIFNNYEFVREVKELDPDAEYLLVTDDPTLTSTTWKVIYDEHFAKLPKNEKLYYVKYHNFEFANTDTCIYVDGSIQIDKSLRKLYDDFIASNSFMAAIMHPCIYTFDREVLTWIKNKRYTYDDGKKFFQFLSNTRYDINYKSYFQTSCTIRTKSYDQKIFDSLVYNFILMNSTAEKWFTIDQLYFAYVLNTWYNETKIFLMHPQIIESNYMHRCEHNTNTVAGLGGKPFSFMTEGYCFNKKVPVYKLV